MTKTTTNLMRKIRRKLERYVQMESTHCGFDGPVILAQQEGEKLLLFLRDEIESLAKKAGMP